MTDALSDAFAALADPTRRALLEALTLGDATVNELAEPFAISLQAISKHLKVLEGAGLISRGRDAQRRPCRLRPGPLAEATGYLAHYRRFWEASFDALADHVAAITTTSTVSADRDGARAFDLAWATTTDSTASVTPAAGRKPARTAPTRNAPTSRPTPTRAATPAARSPRQEGSS